MLLTGVCVVISQRYDVKSVNTRAPVTMRGAVKAHVNEPLSCEGLPVSYFKGRVSFAAQSGQSAQEAVP